MMSRQPSPAERRRAQWVARPALRRRLDHLAEGAPAAERAAARRELPELERLARRYPNDPQRQLALGRAQAAVGDYAAAVTTLKRAIELDQTLPGVHYALGLCYQIQGDVLAAMRAYERELALNPRHELACNNLGTLYALQDNTEQAIACFQRVLEMNPADSAARDNLSLARRQAAGRSAPLCFAGQIPVGPHPTLSLCMIVKNEAHNLPACLESLDGLPTEIIVVDTGSTDDTVEVARRYGAQVYHFPWIDDFAAARNESLRHATGEWVMWFDADFRLVPGHADRIRAALVSGQADAFLVNVRSLPAEGLAGQSEWTLLALLFRNRPGVRFEGAVHEQILPSLLAAGLAPARTDIVVDHIGYADPAQLRRKAERNLELIQAELACDPDNPMQRFQLAQTYGALGRYPEAIAEARRLLGGTRLPIGLRFPVFCYIVQSYLQMKDYPAVLELVEQGEKLFPGRRYLPALAAQARRGLKQWDAAIADLELALSRPSAPPNLLGIDEEVGDGMLEAMLGDCHLDAGRPLEAIAHYGAAQAAGWDTPGSAINRAHAMVLVGDPAGAIRLLEQTVSRSPDLAAAHRALGIAYLQAGQAAPAVAALERAVALDATSAECWTRLAAACVDAGDDVRALEAAEQAVVLSAEAAEVWLALGTIFERLGVDERALACFAQAAERAPTSPAAYTHLGSAYLKNGCLDEAEACFEAAVKLAPEDATALDGLGFVYLKRGRYEPAALLLGAAIQVAPNRAQSYFNLGLALGKLGRREDATLCLETALRLQPGLTLL